MCVLRESKVLIMAEAMLAKGRPARTYDRIASMATE
jgi:hypothetical protein